MASNGTNIASEKESVTLLHIIMIILSFIIIVVNVPVVLLYLKISSLRHSAGNTFLVGLAVADILCACVMVPTAITCTMRVLSDPAHRYVCLFFYVSNFTITLATIYHIVAATAAKYFAIVYPMRNITACTKFRVNFIIAFIWVGSFLVGHIPFYYANMSDDDVVIIHERHSIFMFVCAFAIPTFILTCVHVHIFMRLCLSSRPKALVTEVRNTRSENNCRIAVLFFLLFLFFIISWLPWYLLLNNFIDPPEVVADILTSLRFLAPVLNPLMFTFAKRDFRKAAVSLVSRLRSKQRVFSSRRSYHTQATSSVDRTNFIEQQNLERTTKMEVEKETIANNEQAEK
ncbi:histamine H2 receptor-like [Dendronephthya gigantea]|uniref:histamine H2 receptor-like n=1 Tax=Dendronephthya gigantea TaxID=151771 RepID=UPI00106A4EAB|nr:histamine H2 receptor-like [Dendronephthya gigantea]XP_028398379.1 histamine H2 receptor-like [Dendronephthya gigantea]